MIFVFHSLIVFSRIINGQTAMLGAMVPKFQLASEEDFWNVYEVCALPAQLRHGSARGSHHCNRVCGNLRRTRA